MIPFLITAFVMVVTPGPATISAAGVAKGFGFWPAMRYKFGLLIGGSLTHFIVWIVISGGLLSFVALFGTQATEIAMLGLGAVSLCILFWVAWNIGSSSGELRLDAARQAPGFWRGLLLNLANPKVYVGTTPLYYGIGYELGWSNVPLEFAFKFLVIFLFAFMSLTAWVWFGAAFNDRRIAPVYSRALNGVFGLALGLVTLWVGWLMIAEVLL